MTTNPRDDVVAGQYERWVYPEPIVDLPAWLEHNWQLFDPSLAHRELWPDRPYRADLRILVAGCGTNQAAVLAYTNPGANITAVDVSQTSLAHHDFLKQRYGLRNLDLHLLPIEDIGSLGREFDLIVSTGVLHHLADPQAGLNALARCLRPEGVMALMLYARNGRIGVEMLQGIFRELGLRQDEASILTVKEAIAALPGDHPVASYLTIAPDLAFDAGIVDTFLHGRDRSFTVDDCLDIVESAGLVFQGWLMKAPYEPASTSGNGFLDVVSRLPDRQRWSVMERVNTRNGCHFFMACRTDRPAAQYRIDFTSSDAATYAPEFRHRVGIDGDDVIGPGWSLTLDPVDASLIRGIDGARTVTDLAVAAGMDPQSALQVIRRLWTSDAISIRLTGSA